MPTILDERPTGLSKRWTPGIGQSYTVQNTTNDEEGSIRRYFDWSGLHSVMRFYHENVSLMKKTRDED